MTKELNTASSQCDTQPAAEQGEQAALYKTLAQETSARCAESSAQRHFALPSGAARQKKTGEICAGDKEHERRSGEEDKEGITGVTEALREQQAAVRMMERPILEVVKQKRKWA